MDSHNDSTSPGEINTPSSNIEPVQLGRGETRPQLNAGHGFYISRYNRERLERGFKKPLADLLHSLLFDAGRHLDSSSRRWKHGSFYISGADRVRLERGFGLRIEEIYSDLLHDADHAAWHRN